MKNIDIIQKLFSGSILRVSTLVIHVSVALFMMPFLVKNLGDRNYGIWVLVGTVMGYYGFMDFGLATAVGRFASKYYGESNYDELNKIASTSFLIYLIMGVVSLCLAISSSLLVEFFTENNLEIKTITVIMIIAGLTISSQFPMRVFGGIATAMARYDVLAYIDIFKVIVRTVSILYFILSGYGLITLAIITFVTETIGNIIQWIVTFRIAPFLSIKWSFFHKEKIATLFGYSWIVFISSISEMMRTKILLLLVAGLFRTEFVVFYAIAVNLIEYFQQFIIQALGIMLPVFSRFEGQNDNTKIIKVFYYAIIINTIIVTFVGSNMLFFGKPFILLWMGEKYSQSIQILWILGIPLILLLSQTTTRDLFFGLSAHRYIAAINLAEVILICALSVVFIPLGMIGIAYAFCIGVLLPELAKPYFAAKILKISWLTVYSTLLYTMVRSLTIIVPFFYVVHAWIILDSYLDILVWGLVGALYYSILIYLFVISSELKRILLTAISLPQVMRN